MADNLKSRLKRVQDAVAHRQPDRTPVSLAMDYKFPVRYKGHTQGEYFRNRSIGSKYLIEVFDELGGWDIVGGGGGNTTEERDLLEAPMVIKVPGQDIPEDDVIQWEEIEVFKKEDYDKIIRLGWKKFMEDFYPRFRGWDPAEYRQRIRERALKEREAMKKGASFWPDRGYPVFGGGDVFPPLMMLSCSRTMTQFTLDLHRIPDKVQAAMDAMVDDLIKISIDAAKATDSNPETRILTKSMILERGGGFYYPLRIFERFEMPYMKKMVEAFVAAGITPILHFDQNWTINLPFLKQLPAKKCIMQLDSKTDIFKAKEILKDHICIMGDVPPGLLSFGTVAETTAYCKKLIEVVGKGGGLILGVACGTPVDAKFDNLKAMIDTAKNYNPHH